MAHALPPSPVRPSRRTSRLACAAPRAGLLVLLGTLLAGCASLNERLPPGTPTGQVLAALGRPTTDCPTADGGRWMVWTQQPMGQQAWRATLGPDGRLQGWTQVLTDASLGTLREGHWDEAQVLCAFGPPAYRERVGVPGDRHRVWSYAYQQDGVWNSLYSVYFNDAGQVVRSHPGPDLSRDPDRRWPFF